MMVKRKREDAFVDQLAETLLSDTERDLDSITELQLHKLFLNAISSLPGSKLQKSLQKRAAIHAQALLLRIQQRQEPVPKVATPNKRQRRTACSTAVNFLEFDTAVQKALGASAAQLSKLTAASLGHPALSERLCETSKNGLVTGLQADIVAGRHVSATSLEALLRLLPAHELLGEEDAEWRARPEWETFQRGFELVALAGPNSEVADQCVQLFARCLVWSAAVARNEATPHVVMLAGLHLGDQADMLVRLLLTEAVACEDLRLRPLLNLIVTGLDGAVELAFYQAGLRLLARLRAKKGNATIIGMLRSAIAECTPPAGFAHWVSKQSKDLMGMDEKELEELLDDYEEEPEEALATAGGGFFLDVGVTQAGEQLGQEDAEELEGLDAIGDELDNLDNDSE